MDIFSGNYDKTDSLSNYFKTIRKDLTPEQQEKLMDLLWMHCDMFSTGEIDIGKCTAGKHQIDLSDAVPFKERF